MRRLLFAVPLLLFLALPASAQRAPGKVEQQVSDGSWHAVHTDGSADTLISTSSIGTGAPTGGCGQAKQYVDTSSGIFYVCNFNPTTQIGTWALITGSLPTGCTSPGAGAITCTGTVVANALTATTSLILGSGVSGVGPTATNGYGCTEATSAGFTPTVGQLYKRCDLTLKTFVSSLDGVAEIPDPMFDAVPVGGKCVQSLGVAGHMVEAAAACGGGAVALSALTAAAGSNTIANGNNPQTWNWAQTTDSQDGMAFGETSAATGGTFTNNLANQALVSATTAAASTETPLEVVQGSLTGTTGPPAMQVETTWNNASLAGEGIIENVTNTASAAASYLLDLRVGNASLFGVDATGMVGFYGNAAITSAPPSSGFGIASGWRYTLGNNNGGTKTTAVAYETNNGQEYHAINIGGGSWFTVSNALPSASYNADSLNLNSKLALSNQVFAIMGLQHANCGFTTMTNQSLVCANSTLGEINAATNGSASLGMLVRAQPGAIHVTAQTATKTIYTLCAAAAGACNKAGQYRITWYFNQGGTACGTPTPGQVTFEMSWTDNAGAHSAVVLPMNDDSSIAVFTNAFKFAASNTTGFASGEFNLWSTGAQPIQVTNTYTACGVGTGTWELTATAERVQ